MDALRWLPEQTDELEDLPYAPTNTAYTLDVSGSPLQNCNPTLKQSKKHLTSQPQNVQLHSPHHT